MVLWIEFVDKLKVTYISLLVSVCTVYSLVLTGIFYADRYQTWKAYLAYFSIMLTHK